MCTIKLNAGFRVLIVNLNQQAIPLLPTGSLIQTDSKFGHELIAGPVVGDRQVVAHKEPGVGAHVETIDSARQRYQFTKVIVPVNDVHGARTWSRMLQQRGEAWDPLDNCQHAARQAYCGVPDSPAVRGVVVCAGLLLLHLVTNRE